MCMSDLSVGRLPLSSVGLRNNFRTQVPTKHSRSIPFSRVYNLKMEHVGFYSLKLIYCQLNKSIESISAI